MLCDIQKILYNSRMRKDVDFLIIGSGLAGAAAALKLAPLGRVLLVTKATLAEANSAMAQGGIAAVTDSSDSVESHIQDTLNAGAGLCRPEVVESMVVQGPERIRDLIDWGVQFDAGLTLEGGHSARRVLHIADHTGDAILTQLLRRIQEDSRIEIWSNTLAVDLLTNHDLEPNAPGSRQCLGAMVMNKETSETSAVFARATILATGGAGKIYLYTSNWSGATGDGIAMAYRAGTRLANLEFMQFHPTCLYHPNARNFLISEALRGEGGELVDKSGTAFMKKYSPAGSLAPRDIVARSIDNEMKRSGDASVFLDMTHLDRDFLIRRFPVIFGKCLEFGIDMSKTPIPVVPAAHYLCGGVLTDVSGQTDIGRLFCIGETACTGLHGANRLASNSLLECLVMAHNLSEALKVQAPEPLPESPQPPDAAHSHKPDAEELIVVSHMWDEIRRLMWNYVGIVRSNRRLERAQSRLNNIVHEIEDYQRRYRPHPDLVELRNIAVVAQQTVRCALLRKESRGIHFNLDKPESDPAFAKDTIVD